MSIDFEHYKVFYYVAREKNISRAARRLFISQSSISKTMQKLEEALGCRLLERDNRGVKLTLEGQYLYEEIAPHCEALLLTTDKLLTRRDQETVRLASNSGVSWYILNECIERFKLEHPDVQFSNSNVDSKLMGTTLMENVVDLGFVLTPNVDPSLLGAPTFSRQLVQNPDFRVIELGVYHDIAVAGGGKLEYLKLARRLLKKEDLNGIPVIFSAENDYYMKLLSRPRVAGDIAALDVSTRIEMARMNLGVTFVPRLCVEDELESGKLVELDITDLAMMKRDFYALTLRSREPGLKAKVFLEDVAARLAGGDS